MKIRPYLAAMIMALSSMSSICNVTTIITDAQLKKSMRDELVVIKYFAPWCGVCQETEPMYKAISKNPLFNTIRFYEINIDNKDIPSNSIIGIPTFVFFKNGVEFKRKIGVQDIASFTSDLTSKIMEAFDIKDRPQVTTGNPLLEPNRALQTLSRR